MDKRLLDFANELKSNIDTIEILYNEPMKKHTTFKVGGPCDIFLVPKNIEELKTILILANKYKVDKLILGKGSNLLVKDKGIRGIVIYIGEKMSSVEIDNTVVTAEAGISLEDLTKIVASHNLTGLEFACGIPGNLGGGIYMNAGAYDGELASYVKSVTSIDDLGNIIKREKAELDFGYRKSIFQENKETIIAATFTLEKGDSTLIINKMQDFSQKRESKQPLDMPSAGSTFKRPQGYFVGTLIEEMGLKGLRIGDAMVSTKHAGFVVNLGNASAKDIIDLINLIKEKVYSEHKVILQPEVKIIGE